MFLLQLLSADYGFSSGLMLVLVQSWTGLFSSLESHHYVTVHHIALWAPTVIQTWMVQHIYPMHCLPNRPAKTRFVVCESILPRLVVVLWLCGLTHLLVGPCLRLCIYFISLPGSVSRVRCAVATCIQRNGGKRKKWETFRQFKWYFCELTLRATNWCVNVTLVNG